MGSPELQGRARSRLYQHTQGEQSGREQVVVDKVMWTHDSVRMGNSACFGSIVADNGHAHLHSSERLPISVVGGDCMALTADATDRDGRLETGFLERIVMQRASESVFLLQSEVVAATC